MMAAVVMALSGGSLDVIQRVQRGITIKASDTPWGGPMVLPATESPWPRARFPCNYGRIRACNNGRGDLRERRIV